MSLVFNRPLTPLFFTHQFKSSNHNSTKLYVHNNKLDSLSQIRHKCYSYNKRRMSMIESVTTRVSTDSNSDVERQEVVGVLEQEAFVDDELTRLNSNRLEATLNHLSKWLMVALFSLVLILRRDAKAIWIASGAILNVGLSITLKKILNQERPSSASKSDPGMPSSHAQSIFYIVFVVILSMMDWVGMNISTAPFAGAVLAFGSYFAWLRVSQGFHTISQVIVGAVAGSLFSGLWFWLWDAVVLDAFTSNFWIRLLVVVGGIGCILRFAVFTIQHWILNEH
ncbi:lipid phosphate phosphatase epsilon 2, chloroplastic [Apium graveolens]|uniref:lipid phosphate phosphatase epsilon 2, chloroplastic n=1 Tax=Apium graveolens TaxID=4045 RepID=UPI003D7AD5C4